MEFVSGEKKRIVQDVRNRVARCFGENVQLQNVPLKKATITVANARKCRAKNSRVPSTIRNMETMENV